MKSLAGKLYPNNRQMIEDAKMEDNKLAGDLLNRNLNFSAKLLKCNSKAKHRAPAYSQAVHQVKG